MENNQKDIQNPEVAVLGTHETGITNLFETRTTSEVKTINPPVSNPGRVDPRQLH
ncbi:hypothetical protein PP175_14725 [Aneurinibacillus sp. Ricciae_BoGa-3]|uniref:hypothetical protein n=1 Tax=Aneurinibacillus sp. Ricciae_BoGa-3 TaxID=3022697 RepID=UPI00233F8E27|nr:hypothetical protein [Aneurinibacillus sp. Ricciae_BoGa-3]WCK52684.1 hypothetical protein PP175_14725 [Aneurinibacillus sp. Ricciae_BoGa-3]